MKYSNEPFKSIYKQLSHRRFTDVIMSLEREKKNIPHSFCAAVHFHMNHLCGYAQDGDDGYLNIVTALEGGEEEAAYLLAEIAFHVRASNNFTDTLSYDDAAGYLERALELNSDHVDSLLLYSTICLNRNEAP